MSRTTSTAACAVLAGTLLTTTIGCVPWMFPQVDVEVPDTPRHVLENAADFIASADDPLETIEPGTVVDDLSALDGCWGTAFTETEIQTPLAFFSVYQFDAHAGTYVRWTFYGRRDTGVLWRVVPILSEESGTYELTSDATIEMTNTRLRSNVSTDGDILSTLQDSQPDGQIPARSALITLDGDQMLFFIDAETAADVDEQDERPIFFSFDCP